LTRRGGVFSAAVLAALAVLAGCSGTPAPPPVLHVANTTSQAVMVRLTGSPAIAATPVRACGATAITLTGPDQREIELAVDPTGAFDAALSGSTGDPAAVPGDSVGSAIWSAANIAPQESWLVVGPNDAVTFDTTGPLVASGCAVVPSPS
jgi:hypothetical protein